MSVPAELASFIHSEAPRQHSQFSASREMTKSGILTSLPTTTTLSTTAGGSGTFHRDRRKAPCLMHTVPSAPSMLDEPLAASSTPGC
jgi:hypothetical protein